MRTLQPTRTTALTLALLLLLPAVARPVRAEDVRGGAIVRDRLWAWAHEAGVYNGHWGLQGRSRITPVEGAYYLGVPNVILIRYEGKPAPPFEQYAIPFKPFRRVYWSIVGGSGATSRQEREHVFQLAAAQTNIAGVFMDDFFQIGDEQPPHWLAQNAPVFPVSLTLQLTQAVAGTRLELRQTEWPSGDYRSRDFAVDLAGGGSDWREVGTGRLPNAAGALQVLPLPGTAFRSLRIRLLNTFDAKPNDARSCGLRGLTLWAGAQQIPLAGARAEASSTYPGFEPQKILQPAPGPGQAPSAPAALSVAELQVIRQRLQLADRRLDLGVTLYTHQLTPRVQRHLELCDVVSLWTWKAEDLKDLEPKFEKLQSLMPGKRVLLGCYMWDFGTGKPMPLDRMKHQCELGLRWLKEGRIEGLIFLATNLGDLNLEAVEWTRAWIARVGADAL